MSAFTTPLRLEYLDGRHWGLLQEFDFASEVLEAIVRVPTGFVTDFASVPQLLWNLLPPTGSYGKAAVIHDYLYQQPQMIRPERAGSVVTRKDADDTLLEGMKVLGVGRMTRWCVYAGVRVGGWVPWNKYRRA